MKPKRSIMVILFFVLVLLNGKAFAGNWISEKHKGYNFRYTSTDKNNKAEYKRLVDHGINSVVTFFDSPYNHSFDLFIHPDRHSLDSTWQKDWNIPDFKSECWMVASGIASKLDLISPRLWDIESCEHSYLEKQKTEQLITHELVHVYHGQLNGSHDFSKTEGVDWFVEGLATYASGQCDSLRIAEIRKAISLNQVPVKLNDFWTGKLKYGLSGTMVMYLDKKYGRAKLKLLLPYTEISQIFSALNTTEPALLDGWKAFILKR